MARFARRKRVGLGAGGGRGGAITGLRRRTQRLSDGGARRLRVRLHEDQRGDAAGIGEVLLLHRHDRIDPALRSLCRSRNLLEHSAGAGRFRTMFQSPAPIAARERPGHYGTAMIFKLAEAAERSWCRLDGHNLPPKLILGVNIASSSRCRLIPSVTNFDNSSIGNDRCRSDESFLRVGSVALGASTSTTTWA